MLNIFSDVFANTLHAIGVYKYRYKIVTEVQKLLDPNLAEHAKDNKWQFLSILVSKPKSTDMRLCIDLRKLNSITPLNPQPPFNMDHFMCDLGNQVCEYHEVIIIYTQVIRKSISNTILEEQSYPRLGPDLTG